MIWETQKPRTQYRATILLYHFCLYNEFRIYNEHHGYSSKAIGKGPQDLGAKGLHAPWLRQSVQLCFLARFMYLNFSKSFCPSGGSSGGSGAAPGECYYYERFDRYKIGILLHLAGILPAGILAVMQFTPFIRHRWIMVHRISGYFAILLYTISLVGALMIARNSFGGGLDVQVWIGFVGIGVLVCFIVSYINIKKLQIEQHRAWMLRGWFYVRSFPPPYFSLFINI
jgi:hypothetical protein